MINNFGLCNEYFVDRDVLLSFYLSMILQVDEIANDRHTQMQMVEFYEALARVAEKSSIISPLA